jgi:3-dehydroquinate synthetase
MRLEMLSADDVRRQTELLIALGLPLHWATPADDVLRRLTLDKKRAGSQQRWVLAERIGLGRIRDDVPPEIAREAVAVVTDA